MRYFYSCIWLIQLAVGICLFCISFFIQNQVFQAFMETATVALVLAAALECGKAAAIIWHRYLVSQPEEAYPAAVRRASYAFRVGLLCLSLLCSLVYLSSRLDRPNREQLRGDALAQLESEANSRLETLQKDLERARQALAARDEAALAAQTAAGFARIADLEQALKTEMGRVIGGVFRGERYRELERRLAEARQEEAQALASLRTWQSEQRAQEESRLQERSDHLQAEIRQQLADERAAVLRNDYATDERANHPMVMAIVNTCAAVMHWRMAPLQFVFVFSLAISALIELGILLSFELVTLSLQSLLAWQHEYAIEREILKEGLRARQDEADIRHQADVDSIRQAANQTEAKAEACFAAAYGRA